MFEKIRAAAVRIQGLLDNSKAAQRYALTLPVQACVVTVNQRQPLHALGGGTLDMSESGLGLCLPAVHVNGKTLADNKFQVILQSTGGTIVLEVATARYERMPDNAGYRFGVKIQNLVSKDYAQYRELLKTLVAQIPNGVHTGLSGQALKAA